jgi:hypothetical protein
MWTIVTVEIEEFNDGSNCFALVHGATSLRRSGGSKHTIVQSLEASINFPQAQHATMVDQGSSGTPNVTSVTSRLLLSVVSIARAQNCVPIASDATDSTVVGPKYHEVIY